MLQGMIIVFRWPQKQKLYFEQGQIQRLLFIFFDSVSKNERRIRETDEATRALNVSSEFPPPSWPFHYNCKTEN